MDDTEQDVTCPLCRHRGPWWVVDSPDVQCPECGCVFEPGTGWVAIGTITPEDAARFRANVVTDAWWADGWTR